MTRRQMTTCSLDLRLEHTLLTIEDIILWVFLHLLSQGIPHGVLQLHDKLVFHTQVADLAKKTTVSFHSVKVFTTMFLCLLQQNSDTITLPWTHWRNNSCYIRFNIFPALSVKEWMQPDILLAR